MTVNLPLLGAYWILPVVSLEILPMVQLVANGTIGNQRTLNVSRLPRNVGTNGIIGKPNGVNSNTMINPSNIFFIFYVNITVFLLFAHIILYSKRLYSAGEFWRSFYSSRENVPKRTKLHLNVIFLTNTGFCKSNSIVAASNLLENLLFFDFLQHGTKRKRNSQTIYTMQICLYYTHGPCYNTNLDITRLYFGPHFFLNLPFSIILQVHVCFSNK